MQKVVLSWRLVVLTQVISIHLPFSVYDFNHIYLVFLFPFIAVSVLTGYGFIQFENEQDAMDSVEGEQGSLIKGSKVG